MRSIRIAALLTLVIAPAVFAQGKRDADQAAATITAADVKHHIAFLASDALKGRDTPSPGLDSAASYIAEKFKAYGLKPGGDNGSFLQRWQFATSKLEETKIVAELNGAGGRKALAYASEFFVVPSAAVDSIAGKIMRAGVASTQTRPSPAFAGNIAAFEVPGGELNSAWQQNVQAAATAAIISGARGVVLVLDPEFDADDIATTVGALGAAQVPVPILALRNDVAKSWLADSTASVRVRTSLSGMSAMVPNVVGILEGSDPALKDTYVVYSAHMDHVGVGRPNAEGDSIFNGADDDASGTTAVMEVAQAFASMKERPKRSIIFLLVSGEEKGLYGSGHFVKSPPVAAEKMIANINMDMVGRNSPDSTVAIGQEFSTLGATVQAVVKAHPELKLTVAPDLWPEEQLFFRSDHYNFAVKKIPAVFFTSGLHADYHKQSDEPETIDNDKLARTAKLVFWLGHELANSATTPTWTAAGLKAISQPMQ